MKKTLKIIGKVISWLFTAITIYIFISVIVCIVSGRLPTVFNRNYFIVQTESMSPTIETDEFVVSKRCDIKDVKKGDIITFICIDESQVIVGEVITHRVYEEPNIVDGKVILTTKGDNVISTVDDKKVTEDNFVGVVTYHSKAIGKIVNLFTKRNSLFIFIFIIAMLLFIMTALLKNIFIEKRKLDEEKRKAKLKEELLLEIQEELKEESKHEKGE